MKEFWAKEGSQGPRVMGAKSHEGYWPQGLRVIEVPREEVTELRGLQGLRGLE